MGLSICLSIVEAQGGRLWAIPCEPRGLSSSLRSPLTELPSVIDVAYCEGFRMTADRDDAACTGAVVRKPPMKMLWGGGEDIASIVADVNRWSAPCRS
jgi:hypothetical protein